MRKDQAHRLRYQEKQRIQAKSFAKYLDEAMRKPLTESQLNTFASKLVK